MEVRGSSPKRASKNLVWMSTAFIPVSAGELLDWELVIVAGMDFSAIFYNCLNPA